MSNFLGDCINDFVTERLDAARIDRKAKYLVDKINPTAEQSDAVLDLACEMQRLSYLAGFKDGIKFMGLD